MVLHVIFFIVLCLLGIATIITGLYGPEMIAEARAERERRAAEKEVE